MLQIKNDLQKQRVKEFNSLVLFCQKLQITEVLYNTAKVQDKLGGKFTSAPSIFPFFWAINW